MNPSHERFATDHPDHFFLDPENPAALERHLIGLGSLDDGEMLTGCAVAGDGNMNCTLRVSTDRRSIIVKQARPWVEKYPQFEAPWERVLREAEFYRRVVGAPKAAGMMPKLLACDEAHHLLVLEDLGEGGDYRSCYHGDVWELTTLQALAGYLSALHRTPKTGKFTNVAMRELNHAHIFIVPLQPDNGLDLEAIQPGFREAAVALLDDEPYRLEVQSLGERVYLTDGPCLLHGDFFPGSLVRTEQGPRVIDPEFAFFGRPEFDVAVFLAHLHLAKQSNMTEIFLDRYQRPEQYDEHLQEQLVGVEIMRRLMGYAQLDLSLSVAEKRALLEQSRTLVIGS